MFPVPVPVPGDVVVTVMNAGPPPFANVNACPSASVAETAWFAVAFSATVIAATVPTNTGAWFTLVTVIVNVLLGGVARDTPARPERHKLAANEGGEPHRESNRVPVPVPG